MRPHSVPTALSELVWYWQVLPSPTPRKYVSDVTSTGQRSSPSPCNSMKVGINFHVECKRRFLCAQLDMPRQMCSKNLSVSIETKYWVSWPGWREYQLWKLQLNSLSGSVTAVWIGSEYRGDRTAEKRITAVSVGCTQSLSFRVHSNWETGASESARPSPRPLPRGRASRSLQSLNRKKKGLRAVCGVHFTLFPLGRSVLLQRWLVGLVSAHLRPRPAPTTLRLTEWLKTKGIGRSGPRTTGDPTATHRAVRA